MDHPVRISNSRRSDLEYWPPTHGVGIRSRDRFRYHPKEEHFETLGSFPSSDGEAPQDRRNQV